MNDLKYVSLDRIRPNPFQPRVSMEPEALRELADSIQRNGLLQPPIARALDDGTCELAFGHRRLFAWKMVDTADFPLFIAELTDLEMFEMAVAENEKRANLNPIETAEALRRYMDDFKKTPAETATFFHISVDTVYSNIRLLNLPEAAKQSVRAGIVNLSQARLLLILQAVAGADEVSNVAKRLNDNNHVGVIEEIESAFENLTTNISTVSTWFAPKKFPFKYLEPLTLKDLRSALELAGASLGVEEDSVDHMLKLIESGMAITDEAFPFMFKRNPVHLERIRNLANPPACDKCAFHARLQMKDVCGYKPCLERKQVATKRKEIEAISRKTKIPMYAREDGEISVMRSWNGEDVALFRGPHPDLRLKPSKNEYNNFDGLGYDLKLVVVGELAIERNKPTDDKDEKHSGIDKKELRAAAIQKTRRAFFNRFMWEVVSPIFADIFTGTWHYLNFLHQKIAFRVCNPDFPDGVVENDLTAEADLEYQKGIAVSKTNAKKMIARLIAMNMVDERFSNQQNLWDMLKKSDFIQKNVRETVIQIVAEWEVVLPKSFDATVAQWQAEMEAAVKAAVKEIK